MSQNVYDILTDGGSIALFKRGMTYSRIQLVYKL